MRHSVVALGPSIVLALAAAVGATAREPARASVLTGAVHAYTVAPGDTLRTIGARFGVDVRTLEFDNSVSSGAKLTPGRLLHVDNRHLSPSHLELGTIVINVPQRMLFLDDGRGPIGMPAAVGRRDWPTPVGSFTVLGLQENPTWDVPASIQEEARRDGRSLPPTVPPGPNNPLGRFWIGLSLPGIGIHGTNAPSSIYAAATHGCVRLHPDDVAWLFPRVVAGMAGRTIYEPVLLASIEGTIYLEVHPDVYRRVPGDAGAELRARAETLGLGAQIDWARAMDVLRQRHGVARVIGVRSGRLQPDPAYNPDMSSPARSATAAAPSPAP